MPIALNSAGVPVTLAVSATGMWQAGSIIGTLSVGQLMDRFDPFRVLACGFAVAAGAMLLMTQMLPPVMLVVGLYQEIRQMGMLDSLTPLILVNAAFSLAFPRLFLPPAPWLCTSPSPGPASLAA